MEEEEVRSFKELQARFQKWDVLPLLGPVKLPASVSPTADIGCTWPTPSVAPGRPCSSNHNRPPARGFGPESNTPQTQHMKLTQRCKIQKSSSSPGLLEKPTASSPRKSQVDALLPDVNASNAEVNSEEKEMGASSFQDKLRKWEKVSSQRGVICSAPLFTRAGEKAFPRGKHKSTGLLLERPREKIQPKWAQTLSPHMELAQRKILTTSEKAPSLHSLVGRKSQEKPGIGRSSAGDPCQQELTTPSPASPQDTKQPQLPRTKPLPPIESLGPAPTKPPKPPAVDLQAFQRQPTALTKTQDQVDGKEPHGLPESAESEEPHNYEATISSLRHSGSSINLCTAEEIAGATYEVEIEEFPKPWKSFLHQELCPKHEDEDKHMQGKESCELECQKPAQEAHVKHPAKVDVYEVSQEDLQVTGVHRDGWMMAALPQETMADDTEAKAWSKDAGLAGPSKDPRGYVESSELTAATQDLVAFSPHSMSQPTYDYVDCLRADISKLDFSSSFTLDSVSEESSEEIYDDVYKTKSSSSQTGLDGKDALKRLQQFLRKEKDRFKMKAIASKEHLRALSVSMPDLQLRSQEAVIYDDVNTSEREPSDKDKKKMWKPHFLMPTRKIEKNSATGFESFSPRNFFRTKKQNYIEKNRTREEKLFRQRFQYNKEITVINRAVVCSNNSRNGIFDLPVTPGEELEVIDTTDQNLVICRNSKGKYGYVLIEHLDFKHHGWSPSEGRDPTGRPAQGVVVSRT